jgi:heme oxygenase (biliverdin-IX-beta and delta-forming)
MSRHAGPLRADNAPAVPEPTCAERARTLAYRGGTGTLVTLARRHPGHPFGSIMLPARRRRPLTFVWR